MTLPLLWRSLPGAFTVLLPKVLLKMPTFEGYASVRPSLLRHVSTVVPYECNVFADARGGKCVVRRREIAFFSHCWDLPPDQVRWL